MSYNELEEDIKKLGDEIRNLKLLKAEKNLISEKVSLLLCLKEEYKKSKGEEFFSKKETELKDLKKKENERVNQKEVRKIKRLEEEKKAKEKKFKEIDKKKEETIENDYSKSLYGSDCSLEKDVPMITLKDVQHYLNKKVSIRARVHKSRTAGKLCFVILRQQYDTFQAFVGVNSKISPAMVLFSSTIPRESIIRVIGTVSLVEQKVQGCTIKDYEFIIDAIFVVSLSQTTPFTIENASVSNELLEMEDSPYCSVLQDIRLDNRVIDLRTPANQAIFKLQSAICTLFREYFLNKNFVELHSPKIIETASEGGANVFKIDYFKGTAFLAQSPQFYKQMAICSDFQRVFEIGPVFRAEDSNTHRHLTEFTGLDIEMEIKYDYHEVCDMLGGLFVYLFDSLANRYEHEIYVVSQQYPLTKLEYTENPLTISYSEGVQMLVDAGFDMKMFEDLSTANEKALGKLVKDKYKTDFYILDKYPLSIRPFYTMPCPEDNKLSNSYDFMLRGEEILSGAQRIHDPIYLEERINYHKIDTRKIQSYIDSFKYGCPPHGGGGIGLERVLMLYLGLNNIRKASLFPRDPKRVSP